MERDSSDVWLKRLALTLVVPVLFLWLAPQLRIPRVDFGGAEAFDRLAHGSKTSIFVLGVTPVFTAFGLVEILALVVPRWRRLRTGGPAGRGRLTVASLRLGLLLAAIQSVGLATYYEAGGVLAENVNVSRLILVATLVAAVCVLVLGAQLLDGLALGGGFSLLFTLPVVYWLPSWSTELFGVPSDPDVIPLRHGPLVAAAVLLAMIATVVLLRRRVVDDDGRPSALPMPSCGLVPVGWVAAMASAVPALITLGALPRSFGGSSFAHGAGVLTVVAAVLFAVVLGFAFNRPSKVARFHPEARSRVQRAVAISAAYVLGIAAVDVVLVRFGYSLQLISVIIVLAFALDVIAEARAVREHGALVAVWPEHRLYAIDGALHALAGAGIPAVARSVHQRVLWHFFAPFIPIQILVPTARTDEATQLLEAHFRAHGDIVVSG